MSTVPPLSTVNPMAVDIEGSIIQEDETSTKRFMFGKSMIVLAGIVAGIFLISSVGIEAETTSNVDIVDGQPPVGEFAPRTASTLPRTTFVHLFEWKWTDIEKECINFLGPKGFAAVQVSPPSEHVNHKSIDRSPWWARYQPISYKLESRSGTREEFISMVHTCKSVGVDIYVDAVLNHMGETQTGVGNAGTPFNSDTREYSKFSSLDFNYCNPADIQGSDYANDAYRVRHCELVSLPDLKQSSEYVQDIQAEYLQDLIDIGVSGLRLDAAKHMVVQEVNDILSKVNGQFYIFGEVIDYGGEAISSSEYTPYYDVTEFKYEIKLVDIFTKGRLAELQNIGENMGFMSTFHAVVFVDNHDTQRYTNAPLIFRSGALYTLANVFMLSWPYGYPKVMSSYYFNNNDFDAGPPSNIEGNTKNIYNEDDSMNCFNEWICEHRWREIYQMVHFKNYVSFREAYNIQYWWTNGYQAISYARTTSDQQSHGYVILNKEDFSLSQTWYTGLPDGKYCDIYNSEYNIDTNECNGNIVTVSNGNLQATVNPFSGLVIYTGAMI